jgi:hypothetical protein
VCFFAVAAPSGLDGEMQGSYYVLFAIRGRTTGKRGFPGANCVAPFIKRAKGGEGGGYTAKCENNYQDVGQIEEPVTRRNLPKNRNFDKQPANPVSISMIVQGRQIVDRE